MLVGALPNSQLRKLAIQATPEKHCALPNAAGPTKKNHPLNNRFTLANCQSSNTIAKNLLSLLFC